MALAYQADSPTDHVAPPAPLADGGRERRVHHRREAVKVWAQVDGGWYKVHDLSLGGLRLDRPVDSPGEGGVIEGDIHSRAGNRARQAGFSATVVRVEDDGQRIGVAFAPMADEQIDGLLAILSAVEREFVSAREAELRREELRRALRRLGVGSLIAAGVVTAGFAAWFMR
ncbi:PilZ domain-containing protein [Thalassobaculum fulvum]|uniref:PilZ domain-containing protein n=1 Tax=Thalassobaculum fulvum TaxID=1633335 RepID=UPI00227D8C55|nr:PilZ domain-containing protein [Thalassobaculum fulvum]